MKLHILNGSILALLILICPLAFGAFLKIDSDPSNYELTRSGKTIEILDGMYLMPGDHLGIKSDDAHASVVSSTGVVKPLSLSATGKTLTSADLGAENLTSKGNQTWAWASDWLLQRVGLSSDQNSFSRSVQAATRAVGNHDPIQIPLAGGGELRLIERRLKPLYVAWSGGSPPYRLELWNENQKSLLRQEGVTGKRHKFASLTLEPGSYKLEIADDLEKVLVTLIVLPKDGAPQESGKASNEDKLSAAMQLASRQEGWPFEAYQEAAEIKEGFPFAAVFMNALETGDVPRR